MSILTSAGWMDNRYDDTIERFEEEYDVTVDLQTIPADQYSDLLQSKLTTDSCADVFWIQSNPFAIESVIVNPEEYCIDFTGAEWGKKLCLRQDFHPANMMTSYMDCRFITIPRIV